MLVSAIRALLDTLFTTIHIANTMYKRGWSLSYRRINGWGYRERWHFPTDHKTTWWRSHIPGLSLQFDHVVNVHWHQFHLERSHSREIVVWDQSSWHSLYSLPFAPVDMCTVCNKRLSMGNGFCFFCDDARRARGKGAPRPPMWHSRGQIFWNYRGALFACSQ